MLVLRGARHELAELHARARLLAHDETEKGQAGAYGRVHGAEMADAHRHARALLARQRRREGSRDSRDLGIPGEKIGETDPQVH